MATASMSTRLPDNPHFQRNYIDGQWQPPKEGYTMNVYDPSNVELLAEAPRSSQNDVDHAVRAARHAFQDGWKRSDPPTRQTLLLRLADLIEKRIDEIALVEARDSGHYYRKARELIQATPLWVRFHAGLVDKLRGATIPAPGKKINFTRLEPLGVTAHIVPWNYPFLLYARSVMPALACGNTVVMKPAEQTPLSAALFAEIVEEAGFPPGVFNLVQGTGPDAGAALARHPEINGITFTGSVEVGKEIIRAAAANVTKMTLELGGKSPNIVFEDAPLENAVEGVTQAILSHAGQVCVAGSRLFLHEKIYDDFLTKLVDRMKGARLGPLFDDATTMGPLISDEQLERVESYVKAGREEGARLVLGGERPKGLGLGYYYLPTIFSEVDNRMKIAQEEIFGPVLCAIRWNSEDDLIRQANGTVYGLAAGVWTRDLYRAMRVIEEIDAGVIFVNDWFGEVPWSPHGGYKQSGIGREEGLECIHGYTQVKNIHINYDEELWKTSWADAPL